MTVIDEQHQTKLPRGIVVRLDKRRLKLCGWAAPSAADHAADELTLSLMAGDMLLGTLRRDVARPDVDAHLGYVGRPPGFSVPDFGLGAFAQITGLDSLTVVTGGRNLEAVRLAVPLPGEGDEHYDPLGSRGLALRGLKLTDLWLESARDLSLRFEGSEDDAKTVDAYQCTPGADPILVRLAADQAIGGLLSIATVKLLNPCLPLLLVFKGVDGSIDGIDIIPFPSLVRGGLHEAERLIVGDGNDEVSDTARVATMLLGALLARAERPTVGVATIVLDAAVLTGLEPVLNADVMGWVGDFLGVAIEPSWPDGEAPGFIADVLARHNTRTDRPGHRLHLPADCIPTISGLVNAYPNGLAAQTVTGGMAVLEWNRHGRIWSIWQPPLGDWLDGFQGHETRRFAPALEVIPDKIGALDDRALALEWPLALAIREKATRVGHDSPFEIAADVALPLLRSRALPKAAGFSALILCERSDDSPLPLLESLSRQQSVGVIDVIVSRPTAKPDPTLSDALAALFPDRHRIVALPAGMGRIDRIKAVCESFGQEQVCILDAATILPDPRTIATMLPMLDAPGVATVGCLFRAADGKRVSLGAGYAPTAVNLRVIPALSFSPIDPAAFRQPATYAVAANTTAALVTTKQFLCEINAHGSSALRPDTDDVLLGIQAIERGGLNLCTTLVSAYSDRKPANSTGLGLSLPYRLSSDVLLRIMVSAAIVQTIR